LNSAKIYKTFDFAFRLATSSRLTDPDPIQIAFNRIRHRP